MNKPTPHKFERCKICKECHWTDKSCNPIFFFKHENWGNEFEEIRASNFADAAKKFAILYNEDGDYSLMNDNEDVIISDGKKEIKFNVSAEPDICYYVKEIEN